MSLTEKKLNFHFLFYPIFGYCRRFTSAAQWGLHRHLHLKEYCVMDSVRRYPSPCVGIHWYSSAASADAIDNPYNAEDWTRHPGQQRPSKSYNSNCGATEICKKQSSCSNHVKPIFRPSVTAGRIGPMESCTCRRGGPPTHHHHPPQAYPLPLADPPPRDG